MRKSMKKSVVLPSSFYPLSDSQREKETGRRTKGARKERRDEWEENVSRLRRKEPGGPEGLEKLAVVEPAAVLQRGNIKWGWESGDSF